MKSVLIDTAYKIKNYQINVHTRKQQQLVKKWIIKNKNALFYNMSYKH